MNDSFVREVDEELQYEKLHRFWEKFGDYIIAGAIILVVGVAGSVGYERYERHQQVEAGKQYLQAEEAIAAGNIEQGAEILSQLQAEGPAGYKLLSLLREARLHSDNGDTAKAIANYEQIYQNNSHDRVYREYAMINAGYLKFQQGSLSGLENKLAELSSAGSPWRYSALELRALAALESGDEAGANTLLLQLVNDTNAPQSVQKRASSLLEVIGDSGV